MARSKSSNRWLKEHERDRFVQRAREEGYRSRAAYKLAELQSRKRLIRPGMVVVDLGAAPGAWSQLAARHVGHRGRVIASDILPMEPIAGVEFLQGDFREEAVLQMLLERLGEAGADLVMSDMAPNISGTDAIDQPRAMYLAELAAELTREVLKPGGGFLVKVFQGEGFDALIRDLRQQFSSVAIHKPEASRARSREMYALASRRKL